MQQDALLVLQQVEHDGVGWQDVGVGLTQVMVDGAIIQLDFLELLLRQANPMTLLIEILLVAPM